MKRKTKKFIRFIFFIIFVCYVMYDSNFLNEIKGEVSTVNKQTDIVENHDIENKLEVQFIDVGQADSILIRQDNKYMLIDAGNNDDGKLLVSYFKELGITSFEHVVATHAHEDHIGGMDDIINNFEVKNFYMPDVLTTTKTFEDMLNALEYKNKVYTVLKDDETFKLNDANLKTIFIGNNEEDLNDTSIVLKLSYQDISFLFTGDATKNVETKILDKELQSTVLKVGHHGSSYSNSKEFIDKVEPKYAVIEVGENNKYNHPHSSVLKQFDKRNIKTYRTDKDGTIIFTSDGKNLNIRSIKTDTNG